MTSVSIARWLPVVLSAIAALSAYSARAQSLPDPSLELGSHLANGRAEKLRLDLGAQMGHHLVCVRQAAERLVPDRIHGQNETRRLVQIRGQIIDASTLICIGLLLAERTGQPVVHFIREVAESGIEPGTSFLGLLNLLISPGVLAQLA